MKPIMNQNQLSANDTWRHLKKVAYESTDLAANAFVPQALEFHKGVLGNEQVVANGETIVSLLQKTVQEARKIEHCLEAVEQGLTNQSFDDSECSVTLVTKLSYIRHLAKHASFKEQALLSGELGIQGKGEHSRVLSAPAEFRGTLQLDIELVEQAHSSHLLGNSPLTDELIQKESQVVLSENGHTAKYEIAVNETVASFLTGLRKAVQENGLDLEISTTEDQRLFIQHGQLGSPFVFSGRSENTRLLSREPKHVQLCTLGQNSKARVNGQVVETRGNLLLCGEEHGPLNGFAILWNSPTVGRDRIVSQQKPLMVPAGHYLTPAEEMVTLRSCLPEDLAVGIRNQSGFHSLEDLSIGSEQNLRDALYLIRVSLMELEENVKYMEMLITRFQDMALAALSVTDIHDIEYYPWEMPQESITSMEEVLQQVLVA